MRLLGALALSLIAANAWGQCMPSSVHRAPLTAADPSDTLSQVADVVYNYCGHYHDALAMCADENFRGQWREMDTALGAFATIATTGTIKVDSGETAFDEVASVDPKDITKHTCLGLNNVERDVVATEAGFWYLRLWAFSDSYTTTETMRVNPSPPVPSPATSSPDASVTVTISFDGYNSDPLTYDPVIRMSGPADISPDSYDYTNLPTSFDATFDLSSAPEGDYTLHLRFRLDYGDNGPGQDWFFSSNPEAFTVASPAKGSGVFGGEGGFGGEK